MKAFALSLLLLFALPSFAQIPEEKILKDFQGQYARSVVVVIGEVEIKRDVAVLSVSQLWKGDPVLKGASISIPRSGPIPEGANGKKEKVIVFFYFQPLLGSHEMFYFSGDGLRASPKVTIDVLRRVLVEEPQNKSFIELVKPSK